MHKIILIGWSVMLAAFIYSTRELQAGHDGRATVTSSSYPSVLPRSQQGGLHVRGKYEAAQSPNSLGRACRTEESSFRGGKVWYHNNKSLQKSTANS